MKTRKLLKFPWLLRMKRSPLAPLGKGLVQGLAATKMSRRTFSLQNHVPVARIPTKYTNTQIHKQKANELMSKYKNTKLSTRHFV